MNQTFKEGKRLSLKEEVGNSVSHGIGDFLMLLLLPVSAAYSYERYNFRASLGVSVF